MWRPRSFSGSRAVVIRAAEIQWADPSMQNTQTHRFFVAMSVFKWLFVVRFSHIRINNNKSNVEIFDTLLKCHMRYREYALCCIQWSQAIEINLDVDIGKRLYMNRSMRSKCTQELIIIVWYMWNHYSIFFYLCKKKQLNGNKMAWNLAIFSINIHVYSKMIIKYDNKYSSDHDCQYKEFIVQETKYNHNKQCIGIVVPSA